MPASSGVITSFVDLSRRQPDSPRFAVQRHFVEPRAMNHQRLVHSHRIERLGNPPQASSGSATPRSCTGGRAGLMHGPSRFITVRTCSCRRTSAACFIPG